MSLQNLFEMVKADRYTADGCEALNKAREADVEDRRYKNGEISETTGLMKTPKGWVEPPKGGRTPKSTKKDHVRFNNPDTNSKIKEMSSEDIQKGISRMEKIASSPDSNESQKKLASNFVTAYQRELAKRGGSKSDSITNSEGKLSERGRYAYEEHAKKISNESLESLIRNKDKAFVKHNDEIADIFKKELERRNANKSVQPADIRENERRKAENERDHASMSERDFENRMADEMFRNEAIKMSDTQLKQLINDPTTPKGVAKIYEGVLNRRTSHGNPFHLEHEDPQNMTITKEDEERFGKAALSGLSGPRESASEWITSSNGDRMQVSEAQNKIQSNQQKIDNLKKEMEGKSKADNFRAGAELKRLENENEYLRERVPNTAKDCAPRQLTGDCKIRVRKS